MQRTLILLPLFLFLMASPVSSQSKYLLKISGKVIDKKSRNKIEGVRLTLYINNALVDEKITTKNGKFSFDLKLNTMYVLQATKQSYINSKYEFNTNVPPDVGPEVGSFWAFPCDIELLLSIGDLKSKKPLSKVRYDQKNNRFWYDKEYTAERKSELETSIDQIKAEKVAKEATVKKAAEEAEIKKAAEDEAKKTEEERLAKEAESKKAEEEWLTKEAEEKKAKEEQLAKEAEEKKAKEEQLAKEAEAKKAEEERLAKEAEAKKVEEKRLAAQEAVRKKAEEERLAREAALREMKEKAEEQAAKTREYFISLAENARTEEEQARKRAKAVEALLQRKIDESKAIEEKEKLEKEKEIIKIDQITDALTKAKAKRFFLEEIADSKRAMKQKTALQITNDQ